MKTLGITQRVEHVIGYNERRDCLDQRLSKLSYHLGFVPIPLPNLHSIEISRLLDEIKLDAILLSGGNSIGVLDPEMKDISKERDEFEYELLKVAIMRGIPVFGICRGLQIINLFFGGDLTPIKEHVNVTHEIKVKNTFTDKLPNMVNSYHNWGIGNNQLSPKLIPIAWDNEKYVEACIHVDKPIAGVMWHPEREEPFKEKDINLIREYLL